MVIGHSYIGCWGEQENGASVLQATHTMVRDVARILQVSEMEYPCSSSTASRGIMEKRKALVWWQELGFPFRANESLEQAIPPSFSTREKGTSICSAHITSLFGGQVT